MIYHQKKIPLSRASVQQVQVLCQTILEKNSRNEISVNMAKGISDFVGKNGYVSERQAQWLCNNADFWKIDRPVELREFDIAPKAQGQDTPAKHGSKNQTQKVIAHLKEAVRLLESEKFLPRGVDGS